ncbi:MAG: DUF1311 domain-containing protein [Blastomonas fulva]|uniref:lysozyme inhibitor LprI family protein n=1 Tax=Blastomonas fulva TaxID=1550728 RepID=UPI0024E22016|nr:lysozyme inhibitor LprI family protein [Blastomonas fulva]MDK2759493.1 DUF1311 domain-containing protein [Blastomonas fulva]
MRTFLSGLTTTEATAIFSMLPIIGGVLGFCITRWWTNAGAHEKASHFNNLADLRNKMAASGLSVADIRDFETELLAASKANAAAIVSAVDNDEDLDNHSNLPQHYWTTLAMQARADAKLKNLNARLNEILIDLETLITDDERNALQQAQEAWTNYRDSSMKYAASEFGGGTMAPLVALAHALSLTEERISSVAADLADRKLRTG